jgi:hypothetical protein
MVTTHESVNAVTFREHFISSVAIAVNWKPLTLTLKTVERFYFKRRQMVLSLPGGEGERNH